MKILAGQSIAVRLAASAVFWSLFILLIAGLILSALYRETTERAFDQRLFVYANDLASDLVAQEPEDPEKRDLGIGDPRFDIPLSGWYWEVSRPGAAPPDVEIDQDVRRFVFALTTTFALLGLALGSTTLLQIRFGLAPLLKLRSAVSEIRRGQSERILGEYPRGIAPLAQELNLLLDTNR